MSVPVYIFTGFLEGGKTTVIKETLLDPNFTSDEKTLLLVCEEGIVEYEEAFLKKTNTELVVVEKEDMISYKFLKKLDSHIEPDRVLVEFNGTWNLGAFLNTEMPYGWLHVQILAVMNAESFELYINNMRSMLYEQLLHCETIIFNRCDEQTKKIFLRNNIKAMNKQAQIIYEAKDGTINNLLESELPFDLYADTIQVSDDDYGIWYMDAMEHVHKYEGKEICFKGRVIAHENLGHNEFVLGRYAMVCCADDTSLIALLCKSIQAKQLIPNEWIEVIAQIEVEYDPEFDGDVPILYVKEIKSAEPLEDEFVYFT